MTETELPQTEKLTIGWLIKHVPVSWWAYLVALVVGIFSLGYSFQSIFVTSNVAELQQEKIKLNQEISRAKFTLKSVQLNIESLKIHQRISKLSDDEVNQELKENGWLRD